MFQLSSPRAERSQQLSALVQRPSRHNAQMESNQCGRVLDHSCGVHLQ